MVQLLLDAGALLGESPRWSAQEQRLYWVDIESRKIHRTDPATGIDEVMILAQQVGCIAPRASGGLVAALEDGCALRSEEHTSELQSLMRISYAVFCLKKKQRTL